VALSWAATFTYLGLVAHAPVPELGFDRADLVGHAAASGLLTMLIAEWLLFRRDLSPAVGLALAAAASLALGVAIEILQSGSATRRFEALDLLADAAGVLAGIVLYRLVGQRAKNRHRLTNGLLGLGILACLLTLGAASVAPR
jgi:VanZ family protein